MGTIKGSTMRRRTVAVDRPDADPFLRAADEQLAEATERTYRRLAAGTLKHKRISAPRLAAMFERISRDLAERPAAFALAPIMAVDDPED